jgi:hypothetical protein
VNNSHSLEFFLFKNWIIFHKKVIERIEGFVLFYSQPALVEATVGCVPVRTACKACFCVGVN